MCIYMCVCVSVCVYIYMCVCVCVCLYVYIYMCVCVCVGINGIIMLRPMGRLAIRTLDNRTICRTVFRSVGQWDQL